MRILHVVTLVDDKSSYGGPLTVALNQCRELRRRGHDARIAGGWSGDGEPPAELEGVPVHLFRVRKYAPGPRFSGLFSIAFARWLRQNAAGFDAGHLHLARDLVPLSAGTILRRAGVPYVTQTHGMVMPDSRPAAKVIDVGLTLPVLRAAHTRFALTGQEEAGLANVMGAAGRTTRLPNGVETPDLAPPQRDGLDVLFLGRLHPRKRVMDFARAASVVLPQVAKEVTFSVVGPDDGDLPELRTFIEAHPELGGRLRYEGALPHQAALMRIAQADIFVLPSVDEPYPMTLLEALALGKASICTTSCGVANLLRADNAALVVEPGVQSLITALAMLLGDPPRRASFSERAKKVSAKHFSMTAVANTIIDTYSVATAATPRSGDSENAGPAARRARDAQNRTPAVILNAYSYRNAGDAAIMLSTSQLLRDRGFEDISLSTRYAEDSESYSGYGITVTNPLFRFPAKGARRTPLTIVTFLLDVLVALGLTSATLRRHRPTLARVVQRTNPTLALLLRDAKPVIAGGGYLYTSRRRVNLSFIHSALSIWVARRADPALWVMPNSIGPINRKFDRWLVERAFAAAPAVARERLSLQSSKFAPRLRQIVDCPDIAFYGFEAQASDSRPDNHLKTVRIVAMDWSWSTSANPGAMARYEREMARVCDLLHEKGYQVVLGGHSRILEQGQDDIETCVRIRELSTSRPDIDANCDVSHLAHAYRSSVLVIGTRLHACIMALTAGTPVVALQYQEKAAGVMSTFPSSVDVHHVDEFLGSMVLASSLRALASHVSDDVIRGANETRRRIEATYA